MGVQEKKAILKELLESGKAKGKLTTKEISDALEELDYDVEQVDKMYDLLEQNNVKQVLFAISSDKSMVCVDTADTSSTTSDRILLFLSSFT